MTRVPPAGGGWGGRKGGTGGGRAGGGGAGPPRGGPPPAPGTAVTPAGHYFFVTVSSLNTFFENQNTRNATITKSTPAPSTGPSRKCTEPTWSVAVRHAPPGMKNVTIGIRTPSTSAVTSAFALPPMITAIARPITPYCFRNAMNSPRMRGSSWLDCDWHSG